jgi:hypothetical protein
MSDPTPRLVIVLDPDSPSDCAASANTLFGACSPDVAGWTRQADHRPLAVYGRNRRRVVVWPEWVQAPLRSLR